MPLFISRLGFLAIAVLMLGSCLDRSAYEAKLRRAEIYVRIHAGDYEVLHVVMLKEWHEANRLYHSPEIAADAICEEAAESEKRLHVEEAEKRAAAALQSLLPVPPEYRSLHEKLVAYYATAEQLKEFFRHPYKDINLQSSRVYPALDSMHQLEREVKVMLPPERH